MHHSHYHYHHGHYHCHHQWPYLYHHYHTTCTTITVVITYNSHQYHQCHHHNHHHYHQSLWQWVLNFKFCFSSYVSQQLLLYVQNSPVIGYGLMGGWEKLSIFSFSSSQWSSKLSILSSSENVIKDFPRLQKVLHLGKSIVCVSL
jgi:hypothetical protein